MQLQEMDINFDSDRISQQRPHSSMDIMNDPFNLQRFISAQQPVYDQILKELRGGRKDTHWMWFVFPQLNGLGHSPMAKKFAIKSADEAKAYSVHPVLGQRLLECTNLVNAVEDRSIAQILGYPDDLKFHSSMTLFANVALSPKPFVKALNKYYDGELDQSTIAFLQRL